MDSLFLYRGGKWSPDPADHLIVHSESQEARALAAGFAPFDPSLTEKPDFIEGEVDVDDEVKRAGQLDDTDEAPKKSGRKAGVARGR